MKLRSKRRLRRSLAVFSVTLVVAGAFVVAGQQQTSHVPVLSPDQRSSLALATLDRLPTRSAATKAGYSRKQFSDGWAKVDKCTMRDKILARDMTAVRYRSLTDCTVMSGILSDPYTGKTIRFVRGPGTSAAVQIDHIVAVSDTWQTGAQALSKAQREQLYNDPLELIAVDGPSNEEKGDGDAAVWLPPNTAYVCRYVARQIAVKRKYHLWVTLPEQAAMSKVLKTCPNQLVPSVRG